MHHVQTRPAQAQTQCGKLDASKVYVSNSVEDDSQYIQAVTLHLHQFEGLQESKESLLRNNYGKEAINNELSSAPHSTGAQYQTQSQVLETFKSDEARGPVNGQQPQLVQTTPSPARVRSATPRRPVIIGH